MTSFGWQVLALAVSALQVLAAAPAPVFDDAGTGGDAPDAPDDAATLEEGAYTGTLAPPGDHDWYALRGTPHEPACFEARVTHAGVANGTLALHPSLNKSLAHRLWPGIEARLAVATPNPQGVWLGLGATNLPAVGNASAGEYLFQLARYGHGELGDGDAGTGEDAGDTVDTALPAPQGCFGGTLNGTRNDFLDVFVFDADAGDRATLSLTNGINRGTVLNLVSPSGEDAGTVFPGDVSGIALNETGLWQIQMKHYAPELGQYMIALTIDTDGPPEPRPCEPTCRVF